MAKDVVFPVGYREGATILTKSGPVTVGKNRKASLSDEQHADLVASRGSDYFDHDDQEPTDAEAAADALEVPSAPPAIPPSEEYERYASAHEAASRAHAKASQKLTDTLRTTAAASAKTNDTGEALLDLGGGVVGGGRSAALTKKAERKAAQAAWDAQSAATTTDDDAEATPVQDKAPA